jgi:hypothetical protein
LVKIRPLEILPSQKEVKSPEEDAPTMKVLVEGTPTLKVQEEGEEAHTMNVLKEDEDSIIKNMVIVIVEAKKEGTII